MGHFVNWDDVPDAGLVPSGDYLLSIEDIEEATSKEAAKLMFNASFRVVEPVVLVNMPVYDMFVVGSDEDPSAEFAET